MLQDRGIKRLVLGRDVEDTRVSLHLLLLLVLLRRMLLRLRLDGWSRREISGLKDQRDRRTTEGVGHVGHGEKLVEMLCSPGWDLVWVWFCLHGARRCRGIRQDARGRRTRNTVCCRRIVTCGSDRRCRRS